jgi:protein-disulfide isomerase
VKVTKEIKVLSIVTSLVLIVSFGIFLLLKNDKDQKEEKVKSTSDYSNIILKKTSNHSFSEGPSTAKVTVTEFYDPECETCAQVAPYMKNEMKYYQGRVRWVYRYMAYHPNSRNAIRILESARKQKLYLEAMALLLSKQGEWGAKHDGTDQNKSKEKELLKIISSLPGINMKQLQVDMNDPALDNLIEADRKEGVEMGVTGTPTIFVNGKIVESLNLDTMIERIEAGLK